MNALEMMKRLDTAGKTAIDLKNTLARLALASKLAAIELRKLRIAWGIYP